MVTREYMARCALAHSDGIVGRAFCKALGIEPGAFAGRSAFHSRQYELIHECFENRADPADLRLAERGRWRG